MGRCTMWTKLSACVLIARGCNAQCNNATTTIRGWADSIPLSACKTFTGVIAVATDSEPVIDLNGVEKIEGDFIARDNPNATTFGSTTLREATGKVEFSNIGALANISLPKWESAGMLVLDRVPNPSTTAFQQKGQQISEVYVTNTTFPFFAGLTLVGAQIDVLEIVDNHFLQLVNFQAGNITKSCRITGNGGDLTLQLPNLTYAYSLEISNASEITLPMLSSVSNGLEVSYSEASELSLPELTYVGGDLVLSNNRHLQTIEMGELVNVQGNLEIIDNEDLDEVSGVPYLSSVGRDLNLMGAFESIYLPALGVVRNDIAITSTSMLNCSSVPSSLAGGTYSCNGNAASADPEDPSDESSKKGSGLSTGAKAGIAVGTIALVALLAALAFFLWRWRLRQRSTSNEKHGDAEPAPAYQERGVSDVDGERKDNYEMEFYNVMPHDSSSQKNLMQRSSEMGRPASSGRPGPEGRHEMFNTKDPPAAYELPGAELDEESR